MHVTLAHQPHDVRVFEKEAVTLAAAGYAVALVVPGTQERMERGVHLVPLPPAASRRGASAAVARIAAAASVVAALRPALVHLHDPELIPLGLLFALRGVPVVYDAHEDAPREARTLNVDRPWRGRALSAFWRLNLALGAMLLHGFVAATPEIARTLPARRTVVVRNYPRLERLRPGSTPHRARARRMAYVGNIARIRGLFELLDALAAFLAEDSAELVLVGTFRPESLRAEAVRHPGWARVRHVPWQPWSAVSDILDTCRLGICALHPAPELVQSLPVKLFEYLAKGLPVIASDFSAWAPIVGDSGILIDPLDPGALREAMLKILSDPDLGEDMGRRGAARVNADYNWDREAEQLLELYRRVIGPGEHAASPDDQGLATRGEARSMAGGPIAGPDESRGAG